MNNALQLVTFTHCSGDVTPSYVTLYVKNSLIILSTYIYIKISVTTFKHIYIDSCKKIINIINFFIYFYYFPKSLLLHQNRCYSGTAAMRWRLSV